MRCQSDAPQTDRRNLLGPGRRRVGEAVLSGRFDCAVICAPAQLHVPIATRILSAGVHVLIEKPLSTTTQGVDELLRTRDRSKRQAAVAYVYHVMPVLVQARAYLLGGEIGPVLQATMVAGQPFHLLRPAYRDTYYRDRKMGGGAIQDALTHNINWVESVIGPTQSVVCDCATSNWPA